MTVLTDDGPVNLAVPRDRTGTFEPVLVPACAACGRIISAFQPRSLQ
jgi:hypothetical protein